MKRFIIILLSFLAFSCSGENPKSSGSEVSSLSSVVSWPHEVKGELDIIDAGGFDDSNYASWAVGTFLPKGDTEPINVNFAGSILKEADIDAEFAFANPVTLWLDKPVKEHGVLAYPVTKWR